MALKRVLLVLVLTVAMTPQSSVTQGPSRNDRFTPFECYNDLCVTKGQYCSASEERCKYCQPGHCMDKSKTPTECLPLCPELLSNAATTTRSGESGSNEVAVTKPGEHGAHNDAVTEPASNAGLLTTQPQGCYDTTAGLLTTQTQGCYDTTAGLLTTQPRHLVDTTILVALAIAAVILMILVGVVILYVRAIHKRLRHADPSYRRDVSARELSHVRTSIEEGCSLLAGDSGVSLGSPASGGSSGQSCSTSSNSSPSGSLVLDQQNQMKHERPQVPPQSSTAGTSSWLSVPCSPMSSATSHATVSFSMGATSNMDGMDKHRLLTSHAGQRSAYDRGAVNDSERNPPSASFPIVLSDGQHQPRNTSAEVHQTESNHSSSSYPLSTNQHIRDTGQMSSTGWYQPQDYHNQYGDSDYDKKKIPSIHETSLKISV